VKSARYEVTFASDGGRLLWPWDVRVLALAFGAQPVVTNGVTELRQPFHAGHGATSVRTVATVRELQTEGKSA
jgi:hypothetical protein